jgi:glycosyltransferase involved in cell wall biosynthesis
VNVGIVLPYLKAGGTERQARYIARHLRSSGHRVVLIVAEKKGIFAENVDGETVFLNVPFNKTAAPLFVYRLARTVVNRGIDLLLSRAWTTNMVTAAAGLVTRTPYVLFLSGPTTREGQPGLKLWVEGFFLRRAARILAVSEGAKENCVRAYDLPRPLVEVVHNGIEVDSLQRLAEERSGSVQRFDEEALNVVFVGRINHRKGLDIFLRALHQATEAVPHLKGWVVGTGDVETYRQLADDLGVRERVEFLGEKENPFPEMKQADLFVLPSRSEGFPNVLLEAMALGRPVLAADCETGPREILDGTNGRLFPVEDAGALARHIEDLARDEDARRELGTRARETVREDFRLETQLSKMEDLLRRAAQPSRSDRE